MTFTVFSASSRLPRRIGGAIAAVGSAMALSGCMVAPIDDGHGSYGYSSTTIYTNYGSPPPSRVEYRYAAPSPYHVWVGGGWVWNAGRYDWQPGRWAHPGYRPAPPPPPPRPMGPAARPPQVMPAPAPPPAAMRPDHRPRPPQWSQGERPPPGQVQGGIAASQHPPRSACTSTSGATHGSTGGRRCASTTPPR